MDPNLLRECAQRLLETADFIRNRTAAVTSTTPTTTTTTSNLTNAPGTAQPQPNSATVRSELNRLFGYRPPAPSRAPRNPRANSRGTRRSPYTNAAVGRASSTWSRSFVCMATAGQQTPPSTSERIDLSLNGQRRKRGRGSRNHTCGLSGVKGRVRNSSCGGRAVETTSSYSDALERLQRGLFAKCSRSSQGLSQAVAKRY